MQHKGGEKFVVQFTVQASDVPPFVRLRQLLKLAGRAFGLRCTDVATIPPGLPQDEPGDAEAVRRPSGEEIAPPERTST
jgi:hypothetical protein